MIDLLVRVSDLTVTDNFLPISDLSYRCRFLKLPLL